jgi:predicted nucleic acid-binding protein
VILVDTSVWIDHLHDDDAALTRLLDYGEVLVHPFVVGELALGHIRRRDSILKILREQRQATIAEDDEVLRLIETHKLTGTGIGYVDAHLLASLRLTFEAKLWTRDKRLDAVATMMGLAYTPSIGGVAEPASIYIYAPPAPAKTVRRSKR